MATDSTQQPERENKRVVAFDDTTVFGKAQESEEEEIVSEVEDHVVGCCACCNCGPKGPSKTVKNKSGEPLRYNFKYKIEECCGPSDGLQPAILEQVPEGLAKKGVSLEVWKKYSGQLRDINRVENDIGCCPSVACIVLLSPFLLLTGFCCCHLCKMRAKAVREWDSAFRAWQAKFNEELEPLGIFVKTQSMCYVSRGGKGEKQVDIHRWMAFAMTPKQVKKLKREPHLFGDIQERKYCGGLSERDLCMHPVF